MTIGALVHSEVWNNIDRFEYAEHTRSRLFKIVIATDDIYRDFASKEQERRQKKRE